MVTPYEGSDFLAEPTIIDAHKCLMSDKIPEANSNCDFCNYQEAAEEAEK